MYFWSYLFSFSPQMAYRFTALQVFAATRVRFRTPEHMGEKKDFARPR